MKLVIRGVLLCAWCSTKNPDFMDIWLRDDPGIVAVVVHCTNCANVHYTQCPVVDDEIIVQASRIHWIKHSTAPIMYVNNTIIGYRHSAEEIRAKRLLKHDRTEGRRVIDFTHTNHIQD